MMGAILLMVGYDAVHVKGLKVSVTLPLIVSTTAMTAVMVYKLKYVSWINFVLHMFLRRILSAT